MLTFDWVRVYPVYDQAYEIVWELRGAGARGRYKFLVQRSANAQDWEDVANVVDELHVLDSEVPASIRHVQLYYRVEVESPLGEITVSEPVIVFNNPEKRTFLIAKEIIRRGNILHTKMNGVEIAAIKRKTWGTECTKCHNPILGGTIDSKCTVCFGTSFVGGFHTPVYTYGHIDPLPVVEREGVNTGNTDLSETSMTMLNYPLLRKGDIIVELHSNNRWYIKVIQLTEMKRFPVRQNARVSLIERSDVVYELEVKRPEKEL